MSSETDGLLIASKIVLPGDEYRLHRWKVRDGSSVRKGETVALAIRKDEAASVAADGSSEINAVPGSTADPIKKQTTVSSKSHHKRPTRRKRSVAALAAAAAANVTAAPTKSSAAAPMAKPAQPQNKRGAPASASAAGGAVSGTKKNHPQQQALVPIFAGADGLVRFGRGDAGDDVVGCIEPCQHPTLVDGLCAVCGNVVSKREDSNNGSLGGRATGGGGGGGVAATARPPWDRHGRHRAGTSRVTVSGGLTFTVTKSEGRRMAAEDANRLRRQRKLSLVLDLDHTLVHATNDPRAARYVSQRDDVRCLVLPIAMEPPPAATAPGSQQQQHRICWMQHFVKLRPGVREFLDFARGRFEIGVYTAGTRQYAEQIALILARHLVGATKDQVDLDQLRHRVSRARAELAARGEEEQQERRSTGDDRNADPLAASPAAAAPPAPKEATATAAAAVASAHLNGEKENDGSKNGEKIDEEGETENSEKAKKGGSSSGVLDEKPQGTSDVMDDGSNLTTCTRSSDGGKKEKPAQEARTETGSSSNQRKRKRVGGGTDPDVTSDCDGKPCSETETSSDSCDRIKDSEENIITDCSNALFTSSNGSLIDTGQEKARIKAIDKSEEPSENQDKADKGKSEEEEPPKEEKGEGNTVAKGGRKRARKRVTFGEVPLSSKTDQTTWERFQLLLGELERAEAGERRAVELRRQLFGSRIVSRTDVGDLGRDVKSLRRIFPCGGTMAAVVDDREDVWANAGDDNDMDDDFNNDGTDASMDDRPRRRGEPPENLLLVRPYHWGPFLGFADVNNAAGALPSALAGTNKENGESPGEGDDELAADADEQLAWTTAILTRLHDRYYSEENLKNGGQEGGKEGGRFRQKRTVPQLLRDMRREVLAGTEIVLSGLVPLHRQQPGGGGRFALVAARPPVVRYAENLGAVVRPAVGSATTHVVAAKDGTDKILAARRVPGCVVVRVSWLMECLWTLTRRNTLTHLLGPQPPLATGAMGRDSGTDQNRNPSLAVSSSSPSDAPSDNSNSNNYASASAGATVVRPLAQSTRDNTSSSSSSDDDDDEDLAAELENELLGDT